MILVYAICIANIKTTYNWLQCITLFSTLNATEVVNIFDQIYDILVGICYEGGRAPHKRPYDLTLSTIAAKLYK